MGKKFYLTSETLEHAGVTLRRIQALESFANVNAGDLGGWVESEKNLAQQGECWIYDNAKVISGAHLTGNAAIHDSVILGDTAMVWGRVHLRGELMVFGDVRLGGEFDYIDGIFMR